MLHMKRMVFHVCGPGIAKTIDDKGDIDDAELLSAVFKVCGVKKDKEDKNGQAYPFAMINGGMSVETRWAPTHSAQDHRMDKASTTRR